MEPARRLSSEIHVLPSYFPFPGVGLVPVNAFVIKAREPILVDTGLPQDREAFLDTLRTVIDPGELRWLWLTHPDPDHTGSLQALMESVPHLKLVTTFLGYGMLSLLQPVPLERLYLLNPGDSLDLGDRRITALKPPTFDNPATTAFFDDKSRALLSADCFGALLEEPADAADDLPAEELRAGQTLWATLDAPWLHNVDRTKFAHELDRVRRMEPALVLSAHLPPARSSTEALLANLANVPDAEPFVGPNQAALQAMLADMTQDAPAAGASA
jgi:glyoxylase-like metal-dependent hydrolase (beta-lactamase superfamily II)